MRPNRNAVALIKNPKRLVGTSGFAILRLKDKNILPETLYIFTKTKFFITKMMRANTASLYPAVLDSDILNFKIPLLPMDFQLEIEKLVKDSHFALEQSKELYKEAQNMLYIELGLNPNNPLQSILDFHPTPKKQDSKLTQKSLKQNLNISIRTLKESLGTSGRLDSEYYQSKYEKNEAVIKHYKMGYCYLRDLITEYSSGFAFSSDEYLQEGELSLIRINNIKNADLDMSNSVYLKKEAQKISPKDKVKKGDILISMSGSIGLACLIQKDIEAMINQRIFKINIKNFNQNVLVLFLNSFIAKLQFQRIGTGGVQTNLSNEDILNIYIPLLDTKTQEKIATLIQESFALRAKAKALLEEAKIKVETKIKDASLKRF